MKHLGELNATTFFCSICSIGPRDNCPSHHPEYEPGSTARHYAYLAGMLVIAIVVLVYGMVMAGKV